MENSRQSPGHDAQYFPERPVESKQTRTGHGGYICDRLEAGGEETLPMSHTINFDRSGVWGTTPQPVIPSEPPVNVSNAHVVRINERTTRHYADQSNAVSHLHPVPNLETFPPFNLVPSSQGLVELGGQYVESVCNNHRFPKPGHGSHTDTMYGAAKCSSRIVSPDDASDASDAEIRLLEEELRLKRMKLERKRANKVAQSSSAQVLESLEAPTLKQVPQPSTSASPRGLEEQLRHLILGIGLPKIEVQYFDGSPLDFYGFLQSFELNIGQRLADDQQRLSYLLYYCKGAAKMAIKHCVLLHSDGYREAIRILRARFGRPHEVIRAVTQGVFEGPRITHGDTESLRDLVTQMRNCHLTVSQLGRSSDLDCPTNLMNVVARLPSSLQERWADVADNIISRDQEPTFQDLMHFIEKRISVASNLYGQMIARTIPHIRRSDSFIHRPPVHVRSALMSTLQPEVVKCVICGADHELHSCSAFLAKDVNARVDILKQNKRCFVCLQANHLAKDCRSNQRCGQHGCNRRHHHLLHRDAATGRLISLGAKCESPNGHNVLLGCIPVRLVGPKGSVVTYGFIDNGSDTTLITKSVAKTLGLVVDTCSLNISTVNGKKSLASGKTSVYIQSVDEQDEIKIDSTYTVDSLPDLQVLGESHIDGERWPHLAGIKLNTIPDKTVGILIGCDVPEAHAVIEQRIGRGKQPYAVRTALGWTIRGPCHTSISREKLVNFVGSEEESLAETLNRYFETEFRDDCPEEKALSLEDRMALDVVESTTQLSEGKYSVGLPWRPGTSLGGNYSLARRRLELLKKRLLKNDVLRTKYIQVISDHLEKGYISEVIKFGAEPRWYIPHHPVLHPSKPGKVRIVFDCAATFEGKSLNKFLLSGPDLNNNLTGVLMRFRKYRFALCADIQEMFLQVKIPERDRKSFSFLWWSQGNLDKEPDTYELNVHPFGATSSPFCATFALRRTCQGTNVAPSCRAAVFENFYVDDCLVSCPSVEEAKALACDLYTTLLKGGFKLTKWSSNKPDVLCGLAVQDIDIQTKQELPRSYDQSVLGLSWDTKDDCFRLKIKLPSKPITKRGLLACVASVYDPLGFIAPMTLPARRLLQELCGSGIGWDTPLPNTQVIEWRRWVTDIQSVETVTIPRWIGLPEASSGSAQLHVFSDASDVGYGAVGYIRITKPEGIECHFIAGKSRVAPRKVSTLPRMELVAAVLASKLARHIDRELKLQFTGVVLWTDSAIVLHYLSNVTSRFPTFVANRARLIREYTRCYIWKHVPTNLNPADIASRGARQASSEGMKQWIGGPEFLRREPSEWPSSSIFPETDHNTNCAQIIATPPAWHAKWFESFSSWTRLLRSVAWLTRFKIYLVSTIGKGKRAEVPYGHLSVEEIRNAQRCIIRLVQNERFRPYSSCKAMSCLRGLSPIVVEGVWRVGGRLQASNCDINAHPIILPSKHRVTDLIIQFQHVTNGHVGATQVLANLRRTFWVVKGMAQVKRVLRSCAKCKLLYSGPLDQIMAPLPWERVCTGTRPFRFCGLDYFGPFKVKLGRSNPKRYGCLFTCLQTRAVHIEISHSLTTDSFLMALLRFVNRRGNPDTIFSDNGTNFVGADRELRSNLEALDQKRVSNDLSVRGIQWRFNPPGASHRGGIWERIVRSIKRLLSALVVEQTLTDETLLTSMTEVERIINERPLVPVYDDPKDPTTLRPVDLLLVHPDNSVLDCSVSLRDRYTKSWKQAQHVANCFWKRWVRQYLPILQARHKWAEVKRNIEEGNLVLVIDYTRPRNAWKKGVIVRVLPGSDAFVREADVKTAEGTIRRDIRSLCLLEGDD